MMSFFGGVRGWKQRERERQIYFIIIFPHMDKGCGIITYHDEAVFSLATRWQLCTGFGKRFGKPGSQSKQLIPRQKCKLIKAHIIGVCYLCISWPRGCA